jgi:hypothetical protein
LFIIITITFFHVYSDTFHEVRRKRDKKKEVSRCLNSLYPRFSVSSQFSFPSFDFVWEFNCNLTWPLILQSLHWMEAHCLLFHLLFFFVGVVFLLKCEFRVMDYASLHLMGDLGPPMLCTGWCIQLRAILAWQRISILLITDQLLG